MSCGYEGMREYDRMQGPVSPSVGVGESQELVKAEMLNLELDLTITRYPGIGICKNSFHQHFQSLKLLQMN